MADKNYSDSDCGFSFVGIAPCNHTHFNTHNLFARKKFNKFFFAIGVWVSLYVAINSKGLATYRILYIAQSVRTCNCFFLTVVLCKKMRFDKGVVFVCVCVCVYLLNCT